MQPTYKLLIVVSLTAVVALGLGYVIAQEIAPSDPSTDVVVVKDTNDTKTQTGQVSVQEETPEAWVYKLTPTVTPYELSLHITTESDKDQQSKRSENITLDENGQPRLLATLLLLPFDVTQYPLAEGQSISTLNTLMQQHGDALGYVQVRFRMSGEDLTWATKPYVALDNQTVVPIGSVVLASTNTQDIIALTPHGLLGWNPAAYAECSQWRADCAPLAWTESDGIRAG